MQDLVDASRLGSAVIDGCTAAKSKSIMRIAEDVSKIAYLVRTGMRMLFRLQVLGIFPASTSTSVELDFLGGVELAWYCNADAFVGDNGRDKVDDCDGCCLC